MLKFKSCTQRTKSAQSLTEYLMMMAAVLVIMFIFLRPNGFFINNVNQSLQSTMYTMNAVGTDIFDDLTGN